MDAVVHTHKQTRRVDGTCGPRTQVNNPTRVTSTRTRSRPQMPKLVWQVWYKYCMASCVGPSMAYPRDPMCPSCSHLNCKLGTLIHTSAAVSSDHDNYTFLFTGHLGKRLAQLEGAGVSSP